MEKADILEMAVNHLKNMRKMHIHGEFSYFGQIKKKMSLPHNLKIPWTDKKKEIPIKIKR